MNGTYIRKCPRANPPDQHLLLATISWILIQSQGELGCWGLLSNPITVEHDAQRCHVNHFTFRTTSKLLLKKLC